MHRLRLLFVSAVLAVLGGSVEWAHADAMVDAGNVLEYVLPAAAGGVTVVHKDWEGLWQFGKSLALSQGTTWALKLAIDEKRPNGGHYSMPSGHSSLSFTAAEYMRKRYGWWYGVPSYALASFVAYSRVEGREHWPKDVIVGAGIGIVSSYIFTRPYHGWKIEPQASEKFYGIALSRAW